MKKIIFATKNQGKLKEIKEILKDLPVQIISQEEAGLDMEVEETGTTFEENAILKAKTIMEYTGKIVLADDSGLEVDYLDKGPGVYSARFGGPGCSDKDKNHKIIELLTGVPKEQRTARFICVIAATFPDGDIITTQGVIEGFINDKPKGNQGFGYDPIFYVPQYQCTTAEMSPALKNEISHRGKALQEMKKQLAKKILPRL